MADLHARFRRHGALPAPDLWREIEHRAAATAPVVGPVVRPGGPPDRTTTRLALAGGASLVLALGVLGAGLLAMRSLAPVGSPAAAGSNGPAGSPAPAVVAGSPSPTPVIVPPGFLHGPVSLSGKVTATRTGSLLQPRCGHAAVELRDGRVLVVGGHTDGADGPALASTAEAYDPATGVFTALAGEVPAGDHASATLLGDGRVLIAGGWAGPTEPEVGWESWACIFRYEVAGPDEDSAAAWIFDPTSDTFQPTQPMLHARSGHAAVLLGDGRVLVAGGNGQRDDGSWGPLASAELYDPATGRWEPTEGMALLRGSQYALGGTFAPTATLLDDGRVIVEGGVIAGSVRPLPDDADPYGSEVFDPSTGRFTMGPATETSEAEPVLLAHVGCACLFRWDPRTGVTDEASEVIRLVTIGGLGHRIDGNLLVGDRWVVLSEEWVVVKDLGTGEEAKAAIPGGSRRWASVTPLGEDRVLIAGGMLDKPTASAEVVDLRPQ